MVIDFESFPVLSSSSSDTLYVLFMDNDLLILIVIIERIAKEKKSWTHASMLRLIRHCRFNNDVLRVVKEIKPSQTYPFSIPTFLRKIFPDQRS